MSGPYTQPLVYFFGQGRADGTAAMKEILGGKGAGLAEMTTIGIPVPPGFTIASSLCLHYLESRQFPKRLRVEVENALQRLETATGRHFGDGENPLLVSVRSGAAVSMPGMMETILNLGLNDVTVEGLTRQSQNAGFAWDSYRRFVQMYGTVVFDLPKRPFEHLLEEARHEAKAERDIDLPAEAMQALVRRFKEHIRQETGREFPDDPLRQLWGAIAAVFESWNTRRAIDYRKLHDIPDAMGTAVNIVAMVFGNLGEDSGTGVTFSRDPSTGERGLYGEFLLNAQGEDVVSGSRTPLQIAALKERLPHTHQELERVARTLERHFRDVQDMEFTVERGVLYMLQTRRGQRSRHLDRDLQGRSRLERPRPPQTRFQGFPFDEFHRVKGIAGLGVFLRAQRLPLGRRQSVDRAEMKNARHVRVTKASGGLGFAQEATAGLGMCREMSVDNLQRDEGVEIAIARLVGHTHRASSELPKRSIGACQDFVVLINARRPLVRQSGFRSHRLHPSRQEAMETIVLPFAAM